MFPKHAASPFVSRLFIGLESRRASDSVLNENNADGMESRHRVPDDVTPSQIS